MICPNCERKGVIPMPKMELNGEIILLLVAAIVVIAEVISALAKGKKSLGELSGRDQRRAEMAAIEEEIRDIKARVNDCESRLEQGDQKFDDTREDLKHVLDTLNALLLHFISGNDKENLKKVKESMDSYLSGR